MESVLAKELKLRYSPVALIFTDEKPSGAVQFVKGKWGCVISMLTAAAKGKTAAFDRETAGCTGGSVGLGFSDYSAFPGGIENFLSTGKEGFREGERYKKNPALAKKFIDSLPEPFMEKKYVVFKPLAEAADNDAVSLVVFYVNCDQLAAMTAMANYDKETNDNVVMQFSAGCHSICLLPYMAAREGKPKAVLGLLDVSARPMVDADLLSFTMPYEMFLNMEKNMPDSFFMHHKAWQKVRERIK
jgi:uncharacterized protein (DUF169 family)